MIAVVFVFSILGFLTVPLAFASVHQNVIRIGTRGSPLALVQANYVKQLLIEKFPKVDVQIKEIMTKGDSILNQVSSHTCKCI